MKRSQCLVGCCWVPFGSRLSTFGDGLDGRSRKGEEEEEEESPKELEPEEEEIAMAGGGMGFSALLALGGRRSLL